VKGKKEVDLQLKMKEGILKQLQEKIEEKDQEINQ
jgi:hypothetical protein